MTNVRNELNDLASEVDAKRNEDETETPVVETNETVVEVDASEAELDYIDENIEGEAVETVEIDTTPVIDASVRADGKYAAGGWRSFNGGDNGMHEYWATRFIHSDFWPSTRKETATGIVFARESASVPMASIDHMHGLGWHATSYIGPDGKAATKRSGEATHNNMVTDMVYIPYGDLGTLDFGNTVILDIKPGEGVTTGLQRLMIDRFGSKAKVMHKSKPLVVDVTPDVEPEPETPDVDMVEDTTPDVPETPSLDDSDMVKVTETRDAKLPSFTTDDEITAKRYGEAGYMVTYNKRHKLYRIKVAA